MLHDSGHTHLPFTHHPAFPIRSCWLHVSEAVSKKGEMERGQDTLGEEKSKWIVSTLGLVCFCNEVSYLVWLGGYLMPCVCVWLFFCTLFSKCTFHILSLWRLLYSVSTCFVCLPGFELAVDPWVFVFSVQVTVCPHVLCWGGTLWYGQVCLWVSSVSSLAVSKHSSCDVCTGEENRAPL